ncbi:MAG: hypothetical protein IT350_00385 [Deltaproteobacteria bacterium]|nr:hypothetical protein [Deltaproteobacteria bacterium]
MRPKQVVEILETVIATIGESEKFFEYFARGMHAPEEKESSALIAAGLDFAQKCERLKDIEAVEPVLRSFGLDLLIHSDQLNREIGSLYFKGNRPTGDGPLFACYWAWGTMKRSLSSWKHLIIPSHSKHEEKYEFFRRLCTWQTKAENAHAARSPDLILARPLRLALAARRSPARLCFTLRPNAHRSAHQRVELAGADLKGVTLLGFLGLHR